MKKIIPLSICCLLLPFLSSAASKVDQQLILRSDILGRDVRYTVYLPDGYEENNRFYPVLYLLHGNGDDHRGWTQQGEAQSIADRCIREGIATEMIIVMPDAGRGWYVNRFDGTERYEDMFFRELIPTIEREYRALTDKENRAVAGLSMGGHGAMLYALKHPEMFSVCCALSAAFFTDEQIRERERQSPGQMSRLFGDDLSGRHWQANSPVHLMGEIDRKAIGHLRFWFDCGDDDFLYKGNSTMHVLMRDRAIPHEYRVRDGGHTWTYWRSGLVDVLSFVSHSFRRS